MSRSVELSGPSQNLLLSRIASEEHEQLRPHLCPVKLSLGEVISDSHGPRGYAYFPTTCVVSLICAMENGATAEVALTGNDGVLGTSLFLGGNTTTNRAVVGIAGEALRMDAKVLKDQFTQGGTFQSVLLSYT